VKNAANKGRIIDVESFLIRAALYKYLRVGGILGTKGLMMF